MNGTSTAICFLNPNTKFNKAYLQKIPAGTYRLDFAQTALGLFLFGYYEDGSEAPIVYAGNVVTYAQDAYVGPQIRVAAGATVDTTVRLMLHTGTSTPSAYAGWENIRPIKGRDSVRVERCGENLLNITPFNKYTTNGITYEYVPDGGIHISGTALTNSNGPTFPVWHLAPGKYLGLNLGEETVDSLVVSRNGENHWISVKNTFEILAGDICRYWYTLIMSGTTVDKTVYPYIVPGTAAPTTYTPYIGQTNTLTLPETVYGGEVDAATGDAKGMWKTLTLDGTERWIMGSAVEGVHSFYVPSAVTDMPIATTTTEVCTHYKILNYNDGTESAFLSGEPYAYINTGRFNSVEELKAYLTAQYAAGTPVQVCYKLATPTPFAATGAQPISALAGANTILTDADAVEVTGRADPIKRITDLEDAVASQT